MIIENSVRDSPPRFGLVFPVQEGGNMPFIEKTSSGKSIALIALPLGEVVEKDGHKYLTIAGSEVEGIKAKTGQILAVTLSRKPCIVSMPEFTEVSWHEKARFTTKDASEVSYRDKQKVYEALQEKTKEKSLNNK